MLGKDEVCIHGHETLLNQAVDGKIRLHARKTASVSCLPSGLNLGGASAS